MHLEEKMQRKFWKTWDIYIQNASPTLIAADEDSLPNYIIVSVDIEHVPIWEKTIIP